MEEKEKEAIKLAVTEFEELCRELNIPQHYINLGKIELITRIIENKLMSMTLQSYVFGLKKLLDELRDEYKDQRKGL